MCMQAVAQKNQVLEAHFGSHAIQNAAEALSGWGRNWSSTPQGPSEVSDLTLQSALSALQQTAEASLTAQVYMPCYDAPACEPQCHNACWQPAVACFAHHGHTVYLHAHPHVEKRLYSIYRACNANMASGVQDVQASLSDTRFGSDMVDQATQSLVSAQTALNSAWAQVQAAVTSLRPLDTQGVQTALSGNVTKWQGAGIDVSLIWLCCAACLLHGWLG